MFRVLRKYWKELVIEWRHLQKKNLWHQFHSERECLRHQRVMQQTLLLCIDTLFHTFYVTDGETKPSVVLAEKLGPIVVWLSAKLDCLSVAKCRLKLTKWVTGLMQQVPLHYITVGLCVHMSATGITGNIFCSESINLQRYDPRILIPFSIVWPLTSGLVPFSAIQCQKVVPK